MVYHDKQAHVEEVRSSRHLFVREATIGSPEAKESFQVLFVHGTCGSEQQFRPLLEVMDEKLTEVNVSIRCLLFDAVGCGQSPIIKEWDAYDINEAILDIEALIRKYFDGSTPSIIVGHSYGPSVFLPLLRKLLEQDGKLPINLVGSIFLGTMISFPDSPLKDGGLPIFRLPVFILNILQPMMTKQFIEMGVHPDHEDLRQLVDKASNGNDMFVAKAYYRHSKWATLDDLVAVKELPAMIMHGSSDKIIPEKCGRSLAQVLSNSEFVLVDKCSHLLMLEQPVQVSNAFLGFLQKLKSSFST